MPHTDTRMAATWDRKWRAAKECVLLGILVGYADHTRQTTGMLTQNMA
jgi:hypothetical protein